MQRLIDSAVRKTMNAMFDVGTTGVGSIAFVALMLILWAFDII